MALVDYTSSDEEGPTTATAARGESSAASPPSSLVKRKSRDISSDLPPLPSKFLDLYASSVRLGTRDDPSLHGGKKRSTPHVQGNWPTHLYIEWFPSTTEQASVSNVISKLQERAAEVSPGLVIHSHLISDLGTPLPLHISLSRPIYMVTEQKNDFVATLTHAITESGIRPFAISFSSLSWVANFDRTRWFLVLRVVKPQRDALNKLLHISNTVVQMYSQPPLYTRATGPASSNTRDSKPKQKTAKYDTSSADKWSAIKDVSDAFHVSIAWTLVEPDQALQNLVHRGNLNLQRIHRLEVLIREMKAKVGNAVTSIPLSKDLIENGAPFASRSLFAR